MFEFDFSQNLKCCTNYKLCLYAAQEFQLILWRIRQAARPVPLFSSAVGKFLKNTYKLQRLTTSSRCDKPLTPFLIGWKILRRLSARHRSLWNFLVSLVAGLVSLYLAWKEAIIELQCQRTIVVNLLIPNLNYIRWLKVFWNQEMMIARIFLFPFQIG